MTWHCSSISEDLHRFAAFAQKIVFLLFRNNNKNNFESKCYKFLANLCNSSEMLEQCQVKWWLNYRIYGSVSYSLSCKCINFYLQALKVYYFLFYLASLRKTIEFRSVLLVNCSQKSGATNCDESVIGLDGAKRFGKSAKTS